MGRNVFRNRIGNNAMRSHTPIETQSALWPTKQWSILSVSPNDQDPLLLQAVLGQNKVAGISKLRIWQLPWSLRQHKIGVLLCEHIQTLPNPPSLILTSRLADDRL